MKKLSLKNYKAIFCDYDGTLVGSDFKISENVKNAIGDWRRAGGKFSIVTSKPFQGPIQKSCEELNLLDPLIVNGGAEIIESKAGRAIVSESLPDGETTKIVAFLDGLDYMYDLQDHLHPYTRFEELRRLLTHKQYEDLKDFKIHDVLKIRILTNGKNQQEVDALIDELKKDFSDLNIIEGHTAYSTGIDITSQKANKHLAVLKLCELLKIDPDEVIGIGDGPNDYPLLTACGYKVAMENSPEELKEIADYVTDDYKNDGVAKFINKILSS